MLTNPLVWLHFRMNGGTRGMLVLPLVFAGLVVAFASFSYGATQPASRGSVTSVWLGILTVSQSAFLLMIAPGAIRKAVLRDFQTGMIESHRLAPLSGLRLICGYMLGPPTQAFTLYATSVILTLYFLFNHAAATGAATAVFAGWLFLQVCVIALSFMLSAFVLLVGLSSGGKSNVIGIVFAISVFGGWLVIGAVPGLALVLGVLTTGSLYNMLVSGAAKAEPLVMLVTILLQFAMGATFIAAGSQKIRAPERAMFSLPLSFVLVGVSAVALIVGMKLMSGSAWMFRGFDAVGPVQIYSSLLTFLVLCHISLVAAAQRRIESDRRAALGETRGKWRLFGWVPLVLSAAAALVALGLVGTTDAALLGSLLDYTVRQPAAWCAAMLACASMLWTDYQLYCLGRALNWKVWAVFVANVLLLRAAPVILDLVLDSISDEVSGTPWPGSGWLTALSPAGTFLLLMGQSLGLWVGLGVQVAFTVGVTVLVTRMRAALRPVTRAAPAAPAVASLPV